jgi:hypothetical protein
MIKIFDRLFFMGPMSLGDSFVLCGMVNHYADRCNELHVPADPRFFKTIKTLYQDHPNIRVVSMPQDWHSENVYVERHQLSRILRIDLVHSIIKNFDITPMWDIQLYSNYELSFGLRYSNFRLPKHIEGSDELYNELSGGEPYILVHRFSNDFPVGAPINIPAFRAAGNLPDYKIIEIRDGITDNMMQYVKLIENAQEIHCIPSSFHCLVDSVPTQARLFFHDIREKTSMAVNSAWNDNKWIMVHYPERL